MRINTIAAAALLTFTASAPRAAEISVANDRAAITITGIMGMEDIDKFLILSAGLPRRIVVVFDSPGGATLAGIKIGEIIRAKQYGTFVKHDTTCASACALAWLGGAFRGISVSAAVGFHAAYDASTMQESGWANALVGAYLNKLGLSDNAIYYITHESPTSIQWLKAEDATKLGIECVAVACNQDRCTWTPSRTNITQYTDAGHSIEQLTSSSVTWYFTAWSSVGDGSYADRTRQFDFLMKLNKLFSDPVNYYGKIISQASVIADKESFMNKWPQRNYRVRPSTLAVKCAKGWDAKSPVSVFCNASGIVDYSVASATKTASGTATFSIDTVEQTPGSGALVVGENGKVIQRSR
jgi:hypothetical protein